MIIVTIIYMLVVGISIGILGPDLAVDKAPIQTAFGRAVGPVGAYFILIGTLFSMGGINLAESFIAPRACTSLAEDGMLPAFLNRRTSWGTPWASSVVVAILSILLCLERQLYDPCCYQCRKPVYPVPADGPFSHCLPPQVEGPGTDL